ncbi:M20/M25/M40 family metallo-hydrolase [Variovorax soli]|uniref:Metal-dependent amidase/aminoacylase/carboxypeptidase family protein n=1 Tax=Variovorax soli TaxID=376815 RepID=A0ABU1NMK9_9BURK|nr:M20/M25/M40 family metallo-hydrolase [Variovorax soli]MDR6539280.1 metal-dependent amidase/aminoacylase/carboxypeptidase family protein [Variovorax soli]
MDALPVEERNDLPFKSTAKADWLGKEVPVSHACGHDTHVAMLLGAAQALSDMRAELPGTVVFLFQPAEEQGPGPIPSGAPAMVQAGVLDNPRVDVVMGQHINAGGPLGIGYRRGSLMASGTCSGSRSGARAATAPRPGPRRNRRWPRPRSC